MNSNAYAQALRVHVPVACFRKPFAREYWDSYTVPPPSTVYGMLLSFVGEPDRLRHVSARVAFARLTEPGVSRVLRTFYRWKESDITSVKNRTPDWQELLTDVRLAVWVADGDHEPAGTDVGTLRERVSRALEDPAVVTRFGGLCLGESTHLVDGVWLLAERPVNEQAGERRQQIIPTDGGDLTLPVWPDHVGSSGTRWGRYHLQLVPPDAQMESEHFTSIEPPA